MAEKLIFAQTVEGLLRAMGPLDETAKTTLRQAGIDPDKRLLPAYPLEQFIAALDFAAARVAPGRPRDDQSHEIGRRFMEGYQETLIGQALVAAMRVIGPWRTLERLSNKLRTGNNFSATELIRVGPTEAELWCNQTTRPGWYSGIISRGLEFAGAHDVQVEVLMHGPDGGRFRVLWR